MDSRPLKLPGLVSPGRVDRSLDERKVSKPDCGADADDILLLSESGRRLGLTFTGERVVPGLVETQLWNEHISRYRFASLFAIGRRVLDAGCGTGYGTEVLARSASYALGFDTSPEAVQFAQASFATANYMLGSATVFPVQSSSVDLVTAFEVIEHLNDWQSLVEESRRVLTHNGIFLVSTPNIEYYGESRGDSGPNPFHVHEFNRVEFESALRRVFPCVQIFAQNQQETVTFSADRPSSSSAAFIAPADRIDDAQFFLAVCSFQPVKVPFFADVSSTHNLLREREKHIRGLKGELEVADRERRSTSLLAERAIADLATQRSLTVALEDALRTLQAEREQVRRSAWIRFGRMLGLGPWSDYRIRVRVRLQRNRDWIARRWREYAALPVIRQRDSHSE